MGSTPIIDAVPREGDSGWLTRHPILAFILVCYGFSWGLWSLMILSSHGMLPFRFPTNPLGSFGPAVPAIVLTAAVHGREGLRRLRQRLFQWRESGAQYLFTILSTAALYAVAISIAALSGSLTQPVFENLDRWYMVFPLGLYVLILGGPLGEEIGWRGYLLPALQRRTSPLAAALLVGLIWSVWHLPDFWLEGAAQKGSSILLFAVTTIALSVVFTWVFNKTHGSLFVAVLYHFFVNMTSFCLALTVPSLIDSKAVGLLFVGVTCGTAIVLAATTRGLLGRSEIARSSAV